MAKTKTWQFALTTNNRSYNFIAVDVFLHSGADTYFRTQINCSKGSSYSNSQWVSFGKVISGKEKKVYKSWSGLLSNTRYTFYGELQYSYDGSTYQVGDPTIYLEETILTQAAPATDIRADVGSSSTVIKWTQPMGSGDDTIWNEITIRTSGGTVVATHTTDKLETPIRSWTYNGTLNPGIYNVTIVSKNATANFDSSVTGVATGSFEIENESFPDPDGRITNVKTSAETDSATVRFRWDTDYKSGYVYSWNVLIGRYQSSDFSESEARKGLKSFNGSSCPIDLSKTFTECAGAAIQAGSKYYFRIYVFGKYDYGDGTAHTLLETYDGELVTDIDDYPEGTLGFTIVEAGADNAIFDVDFRPADTYQMQYWYAPTVYFSKSPDVSNTNYEISVGPLSDKQYRGTGSSDLRWDNYTVDGLNTYTTYYAVAYLNFSAWTLYDGHADIPTDLHSAVVTFATYGEPDTPVLALWSWGNATGSWNAQRGEATAAQLSSAETAVRNGGETRNFHHDVWNDMIRWVHDAARIRKPQYNEGWPSAAKMTNSDRVLTAARWHNFAQLYNTVIRYLVSSYTDLTYYNSGTPVLGRYFIEAVDNLNSYISAYKQSHS